MLTTYGIAGRARYDSGFPRSLGAGFAPLRRSFGLRVWLLFGLWSGLWPILGIIRLLLKELLLDPVQCGLHRVGYNKALFQKCLLSVMGLLDYRAYIRSYKVLYRDTLGTK